jgi:hypothetical protein
LYGNFTIKFAVGAFLQNMYDRNGVLYNTGEQYMTAGVAGECTTGCPYYGQGNVWNYVTMWTWSEWQDGTACTSACPYYGTEWDYYILDRGGHKHAVEIIESHRHTEMWHDGENVMFRDVLAQYGIAIDDVPAVSLSFHFPQMFAEYMTFEKNGDTVIIGVNMPADISGVGYDLEFWLKFVIDK